MNQKIDKTSPHGRDVGLGLIIQVKLVARVAVVIALIAVLFTLSVIVFIAVEPSNSYYDSIANYSLTQKKLKFAVGVAGLCALVFTAFLTWIIAIYTTHRIAGPLYNFSKKFENGIAKGHMSDVHLRAGDQLKLLASNLANSEVVMTSHLNKVDGLTNRLGDELTCKKPNAEKINNLLDQIRSEVSRVQI